MSGWKKLAAASAGDDAIVPEGVTFDGSSGERLRNVYGSSGKFYITMSFWIYTGGSNEEIYSRVMTNGQDQIRIQQNGDTLYVYFYNSNFGQQSAGTKVISASQKTWNHLIFSGSFTSSGNKIQFYLNDVDQNDLTLSNDALAMTEQEYVAQVNNAYGNIGMAHLYIRDAVLDLDVESNRRNFITADLKPAEGQGSYLSPRVYLPMLDADTAGVNEGSNNNFTVSGTLDTATRGPNQNNCVASFFDGSNDNLESTSISHSGSKTFTLSFAMNVDKYTPDQGYVFQTRDSSNNEVVNVNYNKNDGGIQVIVRNSGTIIYRHDGQTLQTEISRQYWINISFDLSDTSKRHVYVNGVSDPPTYITYSNSVSGATNKASIGKQSVLSDNFEGSIGEFYFDTSYIDLSAENPFWDDDANLPKPVRQVIEETSSTTLMALPINAANPGDNLGTGGDFNVNGSPFTGARGASQYWARSLNFDNPSFNSGKRLTLNNTDESVIRQTTLALAFKRDNTNATDNVALFNVNSSSANNYQFSLIFDSSENLLVFYNGHQVTNLGNITDQNWHIVLVSIDSTTSTAHAYLDGVSKSASITANRAYTQAYTNVGGGFPGIIGFEFDGDIAFVYQSHDYIDLSDEANRNLFVDQFDYPKDLTPAIEAGDIAEPKVYLKFEDLNNFGKNDGSYGDFTDYTDSESGPDFYV